MSGQTLSTSRRVLIALAGVAALLGVVALRPQPPAVSEEEMDDADVLEALRSLGYVNEVPVLSSLAGKNGVTLHDPQRATPGLNVYNARNDSAARLMANDGTVVHEWSSDAKGETFTELKTNHPYLPVQYLGGWNTVLATDDGGLLVIGSHHMVLRLDAKSELLWKADVSAHHDLQVLPSGEVLTLTDRIRFVDDGGAQVPVQDCLITVFSAEGQVLRTVSLYDALLTSPDTAARVEKARAGIRAGLDAKLAAFTERGRESTGHGTDAEHQAFLDLFRRAADPGEQVHEGVRNVVLHNTAADIFHANSAQAVVHGIDGLWEPGDYLVSVRNLDLVVVIGAEDHEVRWSWGPGEIEHQHHATQLDDGSVMLFDNGVERGFSRILVVDPRDDHIAWQFTADPPSDFFSSSRGSVVALPGGHVLVSDTNAGRAFELTPEGERVWEYYEPRDLVSGYRDAIYRMTRVDPSFAERVGAP